MCINKRSSYKRSSSTRIVTRDEEISMVDVLRNREHIKAKSYYPDVADLLEVLIDTGMRQLESMELLYRDVNFTDNLILIRVTKGNGHRRIPMTKRVAAIMKRRQEVDQLKPFNLSTMQISMAWSWLRTQMGLKDDRGFVLYALRWTCAYRLVNSGIESDMIKIWLGHSQSNSTVTERYAELAHNQIAHSVEMDEE